MTNAFANLEVIASSKTDNGNKWSPEEIVVGTFLAYFNSYSAKDVGIKLEELFGNKRSAHTVRYKILENPSIKSEDDKMIMLSSADEIDQATEEGKKISCRSVKKHFTNYEVNGAEFGQFIQKIGLKLEGETDQEKIESLQRLAGM